MVASAGVALAVGSIAHADWPVGRHDAQRTGAASGVSDIVEPEVIWRYYLGGALPATAMLAIDIGPGDPIYVMAAGGALVARRVDDTVVWRIPPRDVVSLIGASDLDGDGDDELVVGTIRGVLVVDATSGAIEWESPRDLMSNFSNARLADLDGDGLEDLIAVECGPCCAIDGDWPGAAWSFAAGAGAPVQLWEFPQTTCGHGNALTVFDGDGDGDLEVLLATFDVFQVLDGATGAELARTEDVGTSVQLTTCVPLEADGTPGDELACVHDVSYYASERSALLLDWDGVELALRWRVPLAASAGGELSTVDLAVDLGAGHRVVVSARDGADAPWTTYLLDASTGVPLDTLPGEQVAGSAPRPGGGRYLVTASDAGLRGWQDSGGALVERWLHDGDDEPLVAVDTVRSRRASLIHGAAVLPSTGRLLVVSRSSPGRVRALAVSDAGATVVAEIALPTGVKVSSTFLVPSPDRPLALARSDGYLTPYDEDLVPRLGSDDVQMPGLRTGGHYATGTFRQLGGPPRTADLDGDARDEIVIADSRGATVRLDPGDASLVSAPRPTWVIANTSSPTVSIDADGGAALACLHRDPADPLIPTHAVVLRSPAAEPRWSHTLPGPPLSDVVPANLDGDGVPDYVVQWGASGDVLLRTRAIAGVDGGLLWEDVSDPGAGRAPAGVSVGTREAANVVFHVGASRVWVLSGATGTIAAQSPPLNIYYFLPMLSDVDGDGAEEIALTGGVAPLHLLDDDLEAAWISPDAADRPYPYGAIARCPDGTVRLVSQSWGEPSRLKLTTISPTGLGEQRALWLAGGAAHATAADLVASGFRGGQLTASTVHADLSGRGRPSALVGSSDGFLYLVDPCGVSLDAAIPFDAAVGEAVYGDTDGDGKDEILVTAGDGYLHAIQHHSIDPPDAVYDLDVEVQGSADVDALGTGLPLAARWTPVPGAVGYEAAVLDRDGSYLTEPAWLPVNEPEIVFDDVVTVAGRSYRVAVRARSATGRSVAVASDGLRVFDEGAGAGDGGGCCDTGEGAPGSLALALIVSLLGARVRRRGC